MYKEKCFEVHYVSGGIEVYKRHDSLIDGVGCRGEEIESIRCSFVRRYTYSSKEFSYIKRLAVLTEDCCGNLEFVPVSDWVEDTPWGNSALNDMYRNLDTEQLVTVQYAVYSSTSNEENRLHCFTQIIETDDGNLKEVRYDLSRWENNRLVYVYTVQLNRNQLILNTVNNMRNM